MTDVLIPRIGQQFAHRIRYTGRQQQTRIIYNQVQIIKGQNQEVEIKQDLENKTLDKIL